MKKLGILIGIFGLFLLCGSVSASTTESLQPATTITYNEDLTVNGTGRFNSAYIGSTEAGVGGVTFFNGTMINNSVDTDGQSTIPLTLGDDVRIDGEIYRIEVGGGNPIKLADTIRPQTTATYNLGTENYQFNNAYIAGTLTVGEDISVEGDINQSLKQGGAIKAAAYVKGRQCNSVSGICVIDRQFNSQNKDIIVRRIRNGRYEVDFGFDIGYGFFQLTPVEKILGGVDVMALYNESDNNILDVSIRDGQGHFGYYTDRNFMVIIY